MPVHVGSKRDKEGWPIIEDATGEVVAHGKTKKDAHISAYYRNRAHAAKMKRQGK